MLCFSWFFINKTYSYLLVFSDGHLMNNYLLIMKQPGWLSWLSTGVSREGREFNSCPDQPAQGLKVFEEKVLIL